MKTGVYGGTFNPIHSGHIHILREFVRRLELDRVLLIPAGQPPHKEASDLVSAEDRLAMCRLAAAELDEPVEVCAIELERPGRSYTADTLKALRERFPKDEFYLLMGEDMFLTLDKWRWPEIICSLAALCAAPRSHDGLCKLKEKQQELEAKLNARCFVEDIPCFEVSSTQVRELAAAGRSLSGLAPEAVEGYIRAHGLYGSGGAAMTYEEYEAEVKRRLSEARFYHSQCVAEEAARLAERYGADPEKARLAGILHDIMKDTPKDEQLKKMEAFGIMLSKPQRQNPKLWHAICGEAYLRNVLHVKDEELLSAVRCHTSGKGGMTVFEKVLFVADYISADREYPEVEVMRALAEKSLEDAILYGVAWTLCDLTGQRLPVDPDSVDVYNEALEAVTKRRGERP